jgi:hypothetical protein
MMTLVGYLLPGLMRNDPLCAGRTSPMQATRRTPTLIRTAWFLAAACLAPAAAQAAAPPSKDTAPARVGQIIIVGNEYTRQDVILRQVPLYPGQVLTEADLRQAERNLARLNLFERSPDGSVRPTVQVVDNPANPKGEYKDVLINVKEAPTGSLMFGVGLNSECGLCGSIVINERNFDVQRIPVSLDDLLSGRAFRGAGQELRLELMPAAPYVTITVGPAPLSFFEATRMLGWLLSRCGS